MVILLKGVEPLFNVKQKFLVIYTQELCHGEHMHSRL